MQLGGVWYMILNFTVKGKPGGVHVADIFMILSDITDPTRSIIMTGSYPEGITVDQDSTDLLLRWRDILADEDDEDE